MPDVTTSRLELKSMKAQMPIRDLVRFFLPMVRPFWKELSLAFVAMALGAGISVFRPWPLKVVIDLVISHKHCRVPLIGPWLDHAPLTKMQVLYGACAATILISLLSGALTYSVTRSLGAAAQRFVFTLRRDLFAHMQRLSLRFHDGQRTGDLTTRLTADIQAIQDLIMTGVILLGTNGFQVVGMLALMFWLDWRFTLATLSVIPLLLLVVFRYSRRAKLAHRQARKSTGMMAALAQEALSSIRIVQGLAQEEQLEERFEARSEGYLQAYLETLRYQARVGPLADLISAIGLTIVIWYGATRVLSGQLTTGDVVIFFAYATSFYRPMRALGRSSFLYNRASVAAERILEVMSVHSELKDRDGARPAPRFRGEIEFRDVSFEYVPGQRVLSRINLVIAPGEKVAIVGATGAGKSTLVSLVPRFYDPTRGALYIDGQDIRKYTLLSLREQISLVLQDSLLFSGTIRENIAFGFPEASDEEIVAAARTANAEEFIERLPNGYDTTVSERATTLSGGQKQRVAIARAVLRDAPIVILDEPTTGLDAAVERVVMDALERAVAGRTALIIAHRLTTVRLADRIVVVDRGQIIEEGPHAELMALNGAYAHLYRLQMSIYPEDALVSAAPVTTRGHTPRTRDEGEEE
ncbi:MAG: ABC transporter ATP-binding protein [Acidobacteria bacterium]|nr:MAG: ABC transporter ATP-binding protein [Acidobacteriota bacterium]